MINTKARAPNNRDKAYKLYKKGMKLVDIANKLEVSESTVRSWKKRCGWDEENATKKRCNVATEIKRVNKKKETFDDGTRETMMNEDLTPKQRLFCIYYSKSFNATQSYQKAYESKYEVANVEGWKLLVKPSVKKEIERLKEIKRNHITADEDDMVELMMRIVFADIGFYYDFGSKPVPMIADGEVVTDFDGNIVMTTENDLMLKHSDEVDTQIISEIKKGKDGVSIKLADRFKAIEWLDKHFAKNPMDQHKMLYDKMKYELEKKRIEHQIEVDERNNF